MINKNAPSSRRTFLKNAAAETTDIAATGVLDRCSIKTVTPGSDTVFTVAGFAPLFLNTESESDKWGKKPELPTEFSDEQSGEVVIVGAGIAGLNAACAAAGEGAKVIVIEKKSIDDIHDFQSAALNPQRVKNLHLEIDAKAYIRDTVKMQQNCVNQNLANMGVHPSGETLDFYEEIMPISGRPSNIRAIDFSYESWASAGKLLYERCLEMGVVFLFKTSGFMLIQDDTGKVNGVIAKEVDDESASIKFNASRGVILACGNFTTHEELVNDLCVADILWALCNGSEVINNGLAGNNGDGHKMAVWAGGDVGPSLPYSNNCEMPFEAVSGLSINLNGKRWHNEEEAIWMRENRLRTQPGMYAWKIFDVNWQDLIPIPFINQRAMDQHDTFWSLIAKDDNALASASKMDGSQRPQDNLIDDILAAVDHPEGVTFGEPVFQSDKVYVASSLEKLAGFIGFSKEATASFLEEIMEYNKACEAGYDERFGKSGNLLRPIVEAPFIACGGGIKSTPAGSEEGVRIDEQTLAVVRKDNGRPIGGLWAAGGVVGGQQDINYSSLMYGFHGWCVMSGTVAGQNAARG